MTPQVTIPISLKWIGMFRDLQKAIHENSPKIRVFDETKRAPHTYMIMRSEHVAHCAIIIHTIETKG